MPEEEYAAAFAVTSRRHAQELGLTVLAPHGATSRNELQVRRWKRTFHDNRAGRIAQFARSAPLACKRRSESARRIECRFAGGDDISHPCSRIGQAPAQDRPPMSTQVTGDSANGHGTAIVAIVPAHHHLVAEIAKTLPIYARRCRIVVVGDAASDVASHLNDPHVTAADLADENSISNVLAEIDRFGTDMILALESITTWDRDKSLARLATDNSLCELLFLIAKHNVARLTRGELELWGLFPNGWNDAVHPASGPVAGLLKAIARESTGARVGVVCTRGRAWGRPWNAC